ncbi:MAG: GNAT family N-acetyltransferase [Gaiellales bacterium]
MRTRAVSHPEEFARLAGPLLMADEARHTVMLGVCATLIAHPDRFPERSHWVVESRGRTVGAALITPPFHLLVARPAEAGVTEALAGAIHAAGRRLPGVTGARPEAEAFATAWAALTGAPVRVRTNMRLFSVNEVRPVTGVPGRLRDADAGDRGLVIGWGRAFAEETGVQGGGDQMERALDARLQTPGAVVLWEHGGRPASMAGTGGDTGRTIRIGPVYTPPELRARGYASALVAGLSGRLLDSGHDRCLLYTDLANPTSNRIYQRIGYRPVCDSVEYEFRPE